MKPYDLEETVKTVYTVDGREYVNRREAEFAALTKLIAQLTNEDFDLNYEDFDHSSYEQIDIEENDDKLTVTFYKKPFQKPERSGKPKTPRQFASKPLKRRRAQVLNT